MKLQNKQSQRPYAGFLVAIMAAASVSLLGGAGGEYDSAQVADTIESMSPAERNQLRSNYRMFKALPENRQREYRRLQENLEQTPERFEVVKNYYDWLNTIPPNDARALLRITNVEERMARIRELIHIHDPDRSQTQGSQLFATFFATKAERMITTSPRFNPQQMESAIEVLKEQAEPNIRQRKGLENLPTAERHLQVVLISYKSQGKKANARNKPLLESAQIESLLAGVDFPANDPLNLESADNGAKQQQLFHQVLFATLVDELEQELANRMPAAEVLEEFKKQVTETPELQKRLAEIQNPDPQRRLGMLYIQTHDARFARSFGQFATLIKRTLQNRDNRPSTQRTPPGGRPQSRTVNDPKPKVRRQNGDPNRQGQ